MSLNKMQSANGHPPQPLYAQIKRYVTDNILSGEWPAFSQLPSENELVKKLGVSRMTVHRALRELTNEGYLDRVQGVGTYVSSPKKQSLSFTLNDIKDEIAARKHSYSCNILFLQSEPVGQDNAAIMGLKPETVIGRSYIVHKENDIPVMLEDRFVNLALVSEYTNQDYTLQTPEAYIAKSVHKCSHEHELQAQYAGPEVVHYLELEKAEPCMIVNRRSWSGLHVVSRVIMTYAGTRYRLSSKLISHTQ